MRTVGWSASFYRKHKSENAGYGSHYEGLPLRRSSRNTPRALSPSAGADLRQGAFSDLISLGATDGIPHCVTIQATHNVSDHLHSRYLFGDSNSESLTRDVEVLVVVLLQAALKCCLVLTQPVDKRQFIVVKFGTVPALIFWDERTVRDTVGRPPSRSDRSKLFSPNRSTRNGFHSSAEPGSKSRLILGMIFAHPRNQGINKCTEAFID
jgi:hypothetical protein